MENHNNIKNIGVISDTHIPARASSLPNALHDIFNGCDMIIHCGDVVKNSVITELNAIAPVYGVKGNMDPFEIDLPGERIMRINGKFTLCISHGGGAHYGIESRMLKKFSKYEPYMIIFGHSHIPLNTIKNNIFYFNPGSCTNGMSYDSVGKLKVEENKITGEIIEI